MLRATAFGDDWTGQEATVVSNESCHRCTPAFLKNALARLVRLVGQYHAISISNNEPTPTASTKHNQQRYVDHGDVACRVAPGRILGCNHHAFCDRDSNSLNESDD